MDSTPKPFSLQAPEAIAKEYGGNKQKIAHAMTLGIVDPTAGTLAGMFIDRMRGAQAMEQAPQPSVAQQVFAPPAPPQPPAGLGALKAPPPGQPQMPQPGQNAVQPPAPPAPPGMARGGLASLDYHNSGYGSGGIVAFADGGVSKSTVRKNLLHIISDPNSSREDRQQAVEALREVEGRGGLPDMPDPYKTRVSLDMAPEPDPYDARASLDMPALGTQDYAGKDNLSPFEQRVKDLQANPQQMGPVMRGLNSLVPSIRNSLELSPSTRALRDGPPDYTPDTSGGPDAYDPGGDYTPPPFQRDQGPEAPHKLSPFEQRVKALQDAKNYVHDAYDPGGDYTMPFVNRSSSLGTGRSKFTLPVSQADDTGGTGKYTSPFDPNSSQHISDYLGSPEDIIAASKDPSISRYTRDQLRDTANQRAMADAVSSGAGAVARGVGRAAVYPFELAEKGLSGLSNYFNTPQGDERGILGAKKAGSKEFVEAPNSVSLGDYNPGWGDAPYKFDPDNFVSDAPGQVPGDSPKAKAVRPPGSGSGGAGVSVSSRGKGDAGDMPPGDLPGLMKQYQDLVGDVPAPDYLKNIEGRMAGQKKEDMWTALANIGFGAAASKSPFALQAFGEGANAAMPGIQKAIDSRRAQQIEIDKANYEYAKDKYGAKSAAAKAALDELKANNENAMRLKVANIAADADRYSANMRHKDSTDAINKNPYMAIMADAQVMNDQGRPPAERAAAKARYDAGMRIFAEPKEDATSTRNTAYADAAARSDLKEDDLYKRLLMKGRKDPKALAQAEARKRKIYQDAYTSHGLTYKDSGGGGGDDGWKLIGAK